MKTGTLVVPPLFTVAPEGETVMENAGREVVKLPSLTEMTRLLKVPASSGVPLKVPVAVLKVAQLGLLTML